MTVDEFQKIVVKLKAVYADPKFLASAEAVEVWYEMLQDLPYEQAEKAARLHMASSKFLPTIADIREKAAEVVAPEEMTGLEAWALVEKAVKNGIYGSQEEFNKLPEMIQRTLGRHETLREWAMMDIDAFRSVEQSHFLRLYRAEVERNKNQQALPRPLQKLTQETVDKLEG